MMSRSASFLTATCNIKSMQHSITRFYLHHATLQRFQPLSLLKNGGLSTFRNLPSRSVHLPCSQIARQSLTKVHTITFRRTAPLRNFSFTSPSSLRYHPVRPQPHRREFLAFLNRLPLNTVFYGIIGLNATVFTMWFLATEKYVSFLCHD
jgi:hypothetical protein